MPNEELLRMHARDQAVLVLPCQEVNEIEREERLHLSNC